MTKFVIGDKVKSKVSGNLYTVCPVPHAFKDSPWTTDIWLESKDGVVAWGYADDIEHVIHTVNGKRYIERQIPEYGLCLLPITPDVNNPPVGSLWRGIKGGRYVVISSDGDAFDFNTQKVYKLPKTAVFVADKATSVTVSHKDGQL